MILVLISPRQAGLPFAAWLPEESGRLVAVTAAGVAVGDGFAEVVTVTDCTDDNAVLDAARAAAKRHRPRAVLALSEVDVERAAVLRSELGLPGLAPHTAAAYRDKVLMKRYAAAGGIRVPRFAAVASTGEIAAFMASHPGKVVVKPRGGSGATGVHVLDTPRQADDLNDVVSALPYEVEEFVDGVLHHVDAFRVDGQPVAAVASRYSGQGCLDHWTDAPFGSPNPGHHRPAQRSPGGRNLAAGGCASIATHPLRARRVIRHGHRGNRALRGSRADRRRPDTEDAPAGAGNRSTRTMGPGGVRVADRPRRGARAGAHRPARRLIRCSAAAGPGSAAARKTARCPRFQAAHPYR